MVNPYRNIDTTAAFSCYILKKKELNQTKIFVIISVFYYFKKLYVFLKFAFFSLVRF